MDVTLFLCFAEYREKYSPGEHCFLNCQFKQQETKTSCIKKQPDTLYTIQQFEGIGNYLYTPNNTKIAGKYNHVK
jgi:hypothetical protein